MAVKPIPDGFNTVTPYLSIQGADKAIAFYKEALGAEERFRMPGPNDTIMHAELQLGNSIVMLSEANPEWGCVSPKSLGGSPVSFYIYVNDVDASFARALKAGGRETSPVQDMFWGDRMGSFEDPYGHKWTLSTHVKDMTPEEIGKAQAEFCNKQKG